MKAHSEKRYTFEQIKLLRSSIFFLIAFVTFISLYFYYIYRIWYPFYIAGTYFFLILGCAYIYINHNLFFLGRYIAFILTCALSLSLSYVEGYDAQAILFFLPAAMTIQILVNKKEKYRSQSILFYSTWALFLTIALIVSRDQGVVIREKPDSLTVLRVINLSIIFLLCVFYSVFGLIQERWFIKKLLKGKSAAEELKNKRMGMLANLGHEIRTQATSINAASKMLMETKPSEQQKPLIEVLEYNTEQMFHLINNILDLRKIESDVFALSSYPKNLFNILTVAHVPFMKGMAREDVQLLTDIDERISNLTVLVDATRLNQVLHNLLLNAIKYTPKGSITLRATLQDTNETHIVVYIEVADTGVGISSEHLDKVFDSFWQLKSYDMPAYGGSGLGLTIASNIVAQMGSQLKVESEVDKGSRFFFTASFEKAALPLNTTTPVLPDIGRITDKEILVVEDNQMSLAFVSQLLKKKKAIVHQAKNGREAIAVFKERPQIPVILLDLEMPEMSGFNAVGKLKTINPDARIIAFTANIPDQDFIKKLYDLGFDDFLSKPFDKKMFYERILANLF